MILSEIHNILKILLILNAKPPDEELLYISLTKKCLEIFQNKIASKFDDLGNFTVSVSIGDVYIGEALCDWVKCQSDLDRYFLKDKRINPTVE